MNSKSILIITLATIAAFPVQADIFRCEVNGKNVYQTGPCADPAKEAALKMKTVDDHNNLKGEIAKRNFAIELEQKHLLEAKIARESAEANEAYARSEARIREAAAAEESANAWTRRSNAAAEESEARTRYLDRQTLQLGPVRH